MAADVARVGTAGWWGEVSAAGLKRSDPERVSTGTAMAERGSAARLTNATTDGRGGAGPGAVLGADRAGAAAQCG